jgi:hypothetical protein
VTCGRCWRRRDGCAGHPAGRPITSGAGDDPDVTGDAYRLKPGRRGLVLRLTYTAPDARVEMSAPQGSTMVIADAGPGLMPTPRRMSSTGSFVAMRRVRERRRRRARAVHRTGDRGGPRRRHHARDGAGRGMPLHGDTPPVERASGMLRCQTARRQARRRPLRWAAVLVLLHEQQRLITASSTRRQPP